MKYKESRLSSSRPNSSSSSDTSYSVNSVISKDGTKIGYRQYGHGPGLLIVQGAMGTAFNYNQLARALASHFTVYVPDRRGRGMSPLEFSPAHSIDRDVEDLTVVLEKTGAHLLFGLSSGAIITLEDSRVLPSVHKAVAYEPPFYIDGVPVKKIARLNKEIEQGKQSSALVTVFRIVKVGPPFFAYVPRPILTLLTAGLLHSEEKKGVDEYAPMRELIPSMRYDFKVVLDRGDKVQSFQTVNKEILLLGGSKSPKYLKKALDALEKIIPNVRRTEFKGLDHSGPWNSDKGGHPEIVAQSLIDFFNE